MFCLDILPALLSVVQGLRERSASPTRLTAPSPPASNERTESYKQPMRPAIISKAIKENGVLYPLSKGMGRWRRLKPSAARRLVPDAGQRPSRGRATPLRPVSAPSLRDADRIEVRGVGKCHPTLVSQGIPRLALLQSGPAPAAHLFS